MSDKIIFLDIDGVLNVIHTERDQFGAIFHKPFEENLNYIIKNTNAKIVISSTWRASGLSVMKDMWEKRKLPGEVIGITPITRNRIRGAEIQQYIDEHNITNYCIIDDDSDMLPEQLNNFVKTSDNIEHTDCIDIGYGLTKLCADQVINILNVGQDK